MSYYERLFTRSLKGYKIHICISAPRCYAKVHIYNLALHHLLLRAKRCRDLKHLKRKNIILFHILSWEISVGIGENLTWMNWKIVDTPV